MDESIFEVLANLRAIAVQANGSEVPVWCRDTVVENVTKLMSDNASNQTVADQLIGGLRAIGDAGVTCMDNDPLIRKMVSIVERVKNG